MKRFQKLISCYLTLCLIFAGAVGISPVLHRLIEHGGLGTAHTHLGFTSQTVITDHSHEHSHPHNHATLERSLPSGALYRHEFDFPFSPLWRVLSQFLERNATSSTESSKDVPGHQHHSLPEMLISGLIEQALDVSILPINPTPLVFCNPVATTFPLSRDWDAQTASRGPPSARS